MHNVRMERIEETRRKAPDDPAAAQLEIRLTGGWRSDESMPQFAGPVRFAAGEATLEADFPPFLGGEGRSPSPLTYCFYGAMCCYGATFAMQAAMEGVEIRDLRISLALTADFHRMLGLDDRAPLSAFEFEVEVETDASDEVVQRIKRLADERCPAVWAMANPVEHRTVVRKA